MAAKKKAAGPVDVPEVLLEDDGNKLVAKTKATLAKKWNVTRVDSLEGAVNLAWFLVALHREKEARELAGVRREDDATPGDLERLGLARVKRDRIGVDDDRAGEGR